MLLKLLSLPIAAPLAGFRFCMTQLIDMAEQEMLDDAPVREALLLLTLQLQEGEIDDAEYVAREAEIMAWMREIRAYKDERARAQAGLAPADETDGPAVVTMDRGGGFTVEFHDQYGDEDERVGPAQDIQLP